MDETFSSSLKRRMTERDRVILENAVISECNVMRSIIPK